MPWLQTIVCSFFKVMQVCLEIIGSCINKSIYSCKFAPNIEVLLLKYWFLGAFLTLSPN